MKYTIKLLILFFLMPFQLCASLQKEVSPTPKVLLRNLIMIMDNSESFMHEDDTITMVLDFSVALCQQAAPILVHGSTLKNLFLIKKAFKALSKKLTPEELPVFKKFIQEKLDSLLNKWDFYEGANGYFLSVPRQYVDRITKEFSISDEEALGFAIGNRKKFKNAIKGNELIKTDILKTEYDSAPLKAQDVINLFKTRSEEKLKNYMWNIFLIGHGLYPIDNSGQLPEFFTGRDNSKKLDIKKYPVSIGGFEVAEFKKIVNFLITINTNFFAYNSCYAGGFNRSLPYVTQLIYGSNDGKEIIMGSTEPNFIVVVASLTDADTYAITDYGLQCGEQPIPENYLNYTAFFNRLSDETQKFLREKTNGVSVELLQKTFSPTPVRLNDTQLRNILKPIYSWCSATEKENHPLVMFPHTGTFTLIPLDDDSVVLTNAKIQAAFKSNGIIDIKPILVTGKNALVNPKYIFMPAESIPVTINIKTPEMPKLFSLLPGIGVHIIKSINAANISYEHFVEALPFIDTVFPKYFFIEKLIIKKDKQLKDITFEKNDTTLYDVLIISSVSKNVKEDTVTRSDIFFRTAQSKAYHTVKRYEFKNPKHVPFGCPSEKEAKLENAEMEKQALSTMHTTDITASAGVWLSAYDQNPVRNAAPYYIKFANDYPNEFNVGPLMTYLKLWIAQH